MDFGKLILDCWVAEELFEIFRWLQNNYGDISVILIWDDMGWYGQVWNLGLVDSSGIPPKLPFDIENHDNPLKLRVRHFQMDPAKAVPGLWSGSCSFVDPLMNQFDDPADFMGKLGRACNSRAKKTSLESLDPLIISDYWVDHGWSIAVASKTMNSPWAVRETFLKRYKQKSAVCVAHCRMVFLSRLDDSQLKKACVVEFALTIWGWVKTLVPSEPQNSW